MSKQSKDKKRVSLGVGAPSACLVTSRSVWSTVKDNKCMKNEVLANKNTALSWFCSFKTFSHRRDGRTYAQVLSQSTKLPLALPSKHNLGTRIVAIRMNANARSAAPSKVGMSTPGNVFPAITKYKQNSSHNLSSTSSKHDSLLTLQNRFEDLQDTTDNSENCDLLNAREGGATTAQITTAHTNPKTWVTKSPKLLKNQANDLQLHENFVTNVPTDDQCDSTHTTQCNVHSRRDLEENMITPHVTVENYTPDAVSSVQTQFPSVDHCVKEEVVPLYIWDNKHNCKDYAACIRQNGDTFGYIPLSNLKLYQGPQIT